MAGPHSLVVFRPPWGEIRRAAKFNFLRLPGHNPGSLGEDFRTVTVMGVVFGGFSPPFIGLTYYIVPRLCGVPSTRGDGATKCFGCETSGWPSASCTGFANTAVSKRVKFPLWVRITVEIGSGHDHNPGIGT